MLRKTFTKYFLRFNLLFIIVLLFNNGVKSQDTIKQINKDSLLFTADTLALSDSSKIKKSRKAIDSKVHYTADDSIIFNIQQQKAYLFGKAEIKYKEMDLKSAYIEIDFNKSLIFAKGVLDSSNKIVGNPEFQDGTENFKSETITYNYDTKKGIVKKVFSKEGDGYLHGNVIKKMQNKIINIKNGSYTTCNLPHPHYEFRYFKAKVIPDNKIVTGPAYMVIEDVPLPIFIPFGWFPIFKGQTSGIVIPSYGESANRGFYLENGGYYLGINNYMDLTVKGDIYTRGSWAIKPTFRYKKRYKYNGSLNLNYSVNITGEKDSPEYQKVKGFAFRWNHQQDSKARPNSMFSANVNIVSNKYTRYNPVSANDYLSNTFQSSISYQTSISDKYHFTANITHSQNTINKTVSITLPKITFTANRFYPFRKKNRLGKMKWYDNISIGYSMNAENNINTVDSLLFKNDFLSRFRNGARHSVPIQSSFKIFKHFNVSNSINYTERWYSQYINKEWTNDTLINNNDTIVGYVKQDTVHCFKTARDFNFNSSLNTKLYGMLQFGKRSPVKAIRHVMTPSIGFSYRPDFGNPKWGYYKEVQKDTSGNTEKYSIFENAIYGSPQKGKSGNINFCLSNNLEMKVRNRKDTITGTKKIVLINNFTITSSYNLAADSLNWSPLSMSGRTILFKHLNINYSSSWDPYILDSTGTHKLNKFEWDVHKRLFRHTNTSYNFGLNLSLNSKNIKRKKTSNKGTEQQLSEINTHPEEYINWDNPWSLNISYTLRYTNNYNSQEKIMENKIIQTLSFNGSLNITPKWKMGFRSGYDFKNGAFSYTSLNFYRDLHCWEMRFNWIPIGKMKSWNFSINAKSPLLKDLKLKKKKDFRDRYY